MRGYLSIEKNTALTDMVLGSGGLRGLAISLSIGVIAGYLAATLKLHRSASGKSQIQSASAVTDINARKLTTAEQTPRVRTRRRLRRPNCCSFSRVVEFRVMLIGRILK